jgi:cytoskeletal protein CcmA (bactofilin family)
MWTPKNTEKFTVSASDHVSFFSHGFRVIGNISTENDIRVEGVIQGNLKTTKKVIIGETGQVIGDIIGVQVVILGEVVGQVVASDTIIIGNKGLFHGTAITNNIQVESGAEMEANIKKYNNPSEVVNFGLASSSLMNKDRVKSDSEQLDSPTTIAAIN